MEQAANVTVDTHTPSSGGSGAGLFIGAALIAFITKLPIMGNGFGSDYDNFLVAQAARQIKADGAYYASRFPGYPIQEYAYSVLPVQSPWMFHLVTAILSAIAAGVFALIAHKLNAKHPFLLTVAFMVLPAFFVNSITALDYNWALAFFLLSIYGAHHKNPLVAGVSLGVAAGCRLPTLVIGLPILLLFFRDDNRKAVIHALSFVLLAVGVAAAVFYPVYLTYGTDFLTFYAQPLVTPFKILYKLTAEVWGDIGFIALAGVLIWAAVKARASMFSALKADRVAQAYLACIVVNLLVFARAPFEGEYLLPAAALTLLLLGRRLTAVPTMVLAGAFALSLFVGIAKDQTVRGKLVEELQDSAAIRAYARMLVETREARPDNAVVITSIYQPLIELRIGAVSGSAIEGVGKFGQGRDGFYQNVEREQFDEWVDEGRPIYIVENPSPGDLHAMGFNPAEHGAEVIKSP